MIKQRGLVFATPYPGNLAEENKMCRHFPDFHHCAVKYGNRIFQNWSTGRQLTPLADRKSLGLIDWFDAGACFREIQMRLAQSVDGKDAVFEK